MRKVVRKIIPRKDWVLVEPLPTTPRGASPLSKIVAPDSYKEPPKTGKVLYTGPGTREDGHVIPLAVKPGDIVLFGRYSGLVFDNVEFGGQYNGLRLMREGDILARLEEMT